MEVEGVYFEVKRWRCLLRGCSLRFRGVEVEVEGV